MIKHSPYALGATLYMPATRSDILDVVSGSEVRRSMLFTGVHAHSYTRIDRKSVV